MKLRVKIERVGEEFEAYIISNDKVKAIGSTKEEAFHNLRDLVDSSIKAIFKHQGDSYRMPERKLPVNNFTYIKILLK